MSICVPNLGKLLAINNYLDADLTLKLYRNNITPGPLDTVDLYFEVSGGGYADYPILFANWVITSGSPSRADYNTRKVWNFTGNTDAPGTIYGYYVVDSDGVLRWAERFPAAAIPFVPINGSIIKVRPRFSVSSIFND